MSSIERARPPDQELELSMKNALHIVDLRTPHIGDWEARLPYSQTGHSVPCDACLSARRDYRCITAVNKTSAGLFTDRLCLLRSPSGKGSHLDLRLAEKFLLTMKRSPASWPPKASSRNPTTLGTRPQTKTTNGLIPAIHPTRKEH